MIPVPLRAVADIVGGELAAVADRDRTVTSVTIDSRVAGAGTLFVPLPGEHADGHDYIGDALGRGAAGYLAAPGRVPPDAPGAVVVDDPADALLGLGAWVRDTVDPQVVAITGSNGKTTTKDLIAAALGTALRTVATHASYNNELGIPLTLCRLQPDTEVAVIEIGARGTGQIAALMPLVRPDVAVVTSVAGAHLELFGTVDAVAAAKSELVSGLGADGVAVLNADDPRVAAMADAAPGRVVTYGTAPGADLRPEGVALDEAARARFACRGVDVALQLPGAHTVGNALAALAVAEVVGVDLAAAAAGLRGAAVSPWRMELRRAPAGFAVLNDAYNANPASVRAALQTLAAMTVAGRRWAVLGHMAELGAGSTAAHEDIGAAAAAVVDGLVVVGAAAAPVLAGARAAGFAGSLEAVDTPAGAVALLSARLHAGDAVLVKASRSAGLEAVAQSLVALRVSA